ncbi:hypothetical protein CERZMDRAFT_87450 [Cercospora zeae-maydis SCOH1-5]|uniref:Uncharacterized protein n=1 Tax=Cercospora zeae-maydis SCOH1-5 TaxID=717836 RepID=A0A6A6F558_9PEZI|nr:hypothetical protein CERZMDRAFT_87450 [Cercospora zeae-maydis SCOH1-5]
MLLLLLLLLLLLVLVLLVLLPLPLLPKRSDWLVGIAAVLPVCPSACLPVRLSVRPLPLLLLLPAAENGWLTHDASGMCNCRADRQTDRRTGLPPERAEPRKRSRIVRSRRQAFVVVLPNQGRSSSTRDKHGHCRLLSPCASSRRASRMPRRNDCCVTQGSWPSLTVAVNKSKRLGRHLPACRPLHPNSHTTYYWNQESDALRLFLKPAPPGARCAASSHHYPTPHPHPSARLRLPGV